MTARVPPLPQAPAPTPQPEPPTRPPPTKQGKEKAPAPPSPPPNPDENPKYLIRYYDTKLGRAFFHPERYAQIFPHCCEAGEFRKGAYDLASFTACHLHCNYTSSPLYAHAASCPGPRGKTTKAAKCPSAQQVARAAAPLIKKGPPSLPSVQQRFLAPRLAPAPHLDAPAIAATFPDIAARILCKSHYLLPCGFSASVNVRSAISLTVTDKETPAPSYAPYFESFTRSLNWSFPVGENPGALFV